MADGPEPDDWTTAAASEVEKRAEKARAKEQKRAARDAARAQREAERAKLDEETLGKQLGFRVFKDGTVEKEQPSGSAWLQTKLDERGLGGLSRNPNPRSPLISATLVDNRLRKPFDKTRQVAGTVAYSVSAGWVGGYGGKYLGAMSLTIVTNDWTEEVTATADSDVSTLLALNGLLLHAKNGSASSGEAVPQHAVPPPPPPALTLPAPIPPALTPPAPTSTAAPLPPTPSSTAATDVPGALRELKGLHDEGLLTDDEYESRRQLLVAQLPSSAHLPTSTEAATSAEVNAPAGWHPDPYGTARLRWWDGHAWSEHTAP